MAASKNDIEFCGGRARITVHPHNKQYEAKFMLLKPENNTPYTYFDLFVVLKKLQEENPQLSHLVEPWIRKLHPKADTNPTRVFCMYAQGEDKQAAKARVMELCRQVMGSLAKLVFRPLFAQNLSSGDVTVNHYVQYQEDTLFNADLPAVRTRLMGCLKNYILPVLGDVKLKDLSKERQEKALRAINRTLRKQKSKSALCGYVRRAYKGLLIAIESSGWKGCYVGMRLADLITQTHEKNTVIRNSVRVDHLDSNQRMKLFLLLKNLYFLYESFIVGLIYSGMDLSEIAAARFGDFAVLEMQDGDVCYTLVVSKRVRKLHDRYSTFGAVNEAYPIAKFRRIVLYPWASLLMLKWVEALRNKGYADEQIEKMRLAERSTGNTITGPAELSNLLVAVLEQAGVKEASVTRTNKEGVAYRETLPVDVELLRRDARFMAVYCGADRVMEHAMFGDAWSETDEQAYINLLCDEYAVIRYCHLRRWSPYASGQRASSDENHLVGYAEKPARHTLAISNPTDHPLTLTLTGSFAINAEWKISKEVSTHENGS